MTLPVPPPDRIVNQAPLVVDKERRRAPPTATPFAIGPSGLGADEPALDSAAPVGVDAGTGAALVELSPIDTVPLSVAIDHYRDAE